MQKRTDKGKDTDISGMRLEEVLESRGYQVICREGSGAFARVYRAKRQRDGRILACKVADGGTRSAVLCREAELLKQLDHPLFPEYTEYVQGDGWALLVMEYVEGCDLENVMEQGPIVQREAVRIVTELAEGLKYLHGRPGTILYRDLKPGNIRITTDGRVRLLDLGCACKADDASHSLAGSRGFAAPEQFGQNGGVCGAYSDVYALGRLLHYLLTGENPCLPPYDKQPLRAYDRRLSPLLECLVEQCTEREPGKRPSDMGHVLHRLEPFAEGNGMRLFWLEKTAAIRWLLGGKKWSTAYICEKNVCIFPNAENLSGKNIVV